MQRKGPSIAIVIGKGGGPPGKPMDDEGPEGEAPGQTTGDEEAEDVGQCPECGATFNYDTGDVLEHGILHGGPGPEGGGVESSLPHMPLQPSGPNPGEGGR